MTKAALPGGGGAWRLPVATKDVLPSHRGTRNRCPHVGDSVFFCISVLVKNNWFESSLPCRAATKQKGSEAPLASAARSPVAPSTVTKNGRSSARPIRSTAAAALRQRTSRCSLSAACRCARNAARSFLARHRACMRCTPFCFERSSRSPRFAASVPRALRMRQAACNKSHIAAGWHIDERLAAKI